MSPLDPEDPDSIAVAFGIASPLVREIEYENDEYWDWKGNGPATPEGRWQHMRDWAVRHLAKATDESAPLQAGCR
jgi:hypothetical protein